MEDTPPDPLADPSLSTPLLRLPFQSMSDADDFADSAPSEHRSNFCTKINPLNALRSVKRRTIEHYHNISLSELSGSLGDLGTFIPLTVALARERKIALAPALFWAGISNIFTGYAWDVPMCVQPMKSIAAVALTDIAAGTSGYTATGLDAQSVTTAGILTGGAVLLLGVTNLMEVVNMIIPLTVVTGLQVGVGLRLASKGIRDISQLSWGGGYDSIAVAIALALLSMFWLRENEKKKETKDGGEQRPSSIQNAQTNCDADDAMEEAASGSHHLETATELQPHSPISSTAHTNGSSSLSIHSEEPTQSSQLQTRDKSFFPSCLGKIWKRLCCCLNPSPTTPHPVGIYLFLIGCIFAAITLATAGPDSGYDLPLQLFGAPVVINAMEGVTAINWRQGLLQGALPQLPLTTLNSVISVCCLAHTLYPEKRDPLLVQKHRTDAVVTRREVSISVGLMNLILCPIGSMPNCHGAGGLAGQHRFGARTGTSVVILGLWKAFLAVFFGASALTLLDALPVAVLGIMLVIAGLELVGTGVGMLFECISKENNKAEAQIEEASCGNDTGPVAVDQKVIMRKNALVSMVTACVIVALQKTHYGAISGWVTHMVYGDGFHQLLGWIKKKRRKRGGDH